MQFWNIMNSKYNNSSIVIIIVIKWTDNEVIINIFYMTFEYDIYTICLMWIIFTIRHHWKQG